MWANNHSPTHQRSIAQTHPRIQDLALTWLSKWQWSKFVHVAASACLVYSLKVLPFAYLQIQKYPRRGPLANGRLACFLLLTVRCFMMFPSEVQPTASGRVFVCSRFDCLARCHDADRLPQVDSRPTRAYPCRLIWRKPMTPMTPMTINLRGSQWFQRWSLWASPRPTPAPASLFHASLGSNSLQRRMMPRHGPGHWAQVKKNVEKWTSMLRKKHTLQQYLLIYSTMSCQNKRKMVQV